MYAIAIYISFLFWFAVKRLRINIASLGPLLLEGGITYILRKAKNRKTSGKTKIQNGKQKKKNPQKIVKFPENGFFFLKKKENKNFRKTESSLFFEKRTFFRRRNRDNSPGKRQTELFSENGKCY